MRQIHQLGGQQQDISQKNTIHPQLIGDFFAKFHFSLVDARLAGTLVDGINNRKAKEVFEIKTTYLIESTGYDFLNKT